MTFARTIAATRTPAPPPSGDPFSVRWNFRATQGFGGGGEAGNEIWANHTFTYPNAFTTPDGDNVTAGWVSNTNMDSRDRNAGLSRYLRGITFISNTNGRRTWRVDATGTITVHVCFGDEAGAQNNRCEIWDGPPGVAGGGELLWDYASPINRWGVVGYGSNPVSSGQYSPSSAAFEHFETFTINTYLAMVIGDHPSGSASTTLASMEVNKLP